MSKLSKSSKKPGQLLFKPLKKKIKIQVQLLGNKRVAKDLYTTLCTAQHFKAGMLNFVCIIV